MSIVLETVFVGLDYHSQSVQVCVVDRQGKLLMNQRCSNDWRAVRGSCEPAVREGRARAGGDRVVLWRGQPGR